MTWYDRNSVGSARPAVFAERSRSNAARPAWIVLEPNDSVSDSGVFPLRTHGEASLTEGQQHADAGSTLPKRPNLCPVSAEMEAESSAAPTAAPALGVVAANNAGLEAGALEALERSLADFALLRSRLLKQTEEQVVALASKIARRVIGREISEDPRILLTLASEGLESLVSRDQTTIRIGSWMDDGTFESMRARLQAQCPGCRVVQDPDLGVGGCVVETDMGRVDESIDVRLENVLSVLIPGRDAGRL